MKGSGVPSFKETSRSGIKKTEEKNSEILYPLGCQPLSLSVRVKTRIFSFRELLNAPVLLNSEWELFLQLALVSLPCFEWESPGRTEITISAFHWKGWSGSSWINICNAKTVFSAEFNLKLFWYLFFSTRNVNNTTVCRLDIRMAHGYDIASLVLTKLNFPFRLMCRAGLLVFAQIKMWHLCYKLFIAQERLHIKFISIISGALRPIVLKTSFRHIKLQHA